MLTVVQIRDNNAQEILRKLKENNGYCPCALEKTEDTKCMCKDFREQKIVGRCHCGLYEKIENKNITTLSHLKKIVNSLEKNLDGKDDMEIPFEYLVSSCFPACYQNIQAEMQRQYTLGYKQGVSINK